MTLRAWHWIRVLAGLDDLGWPVVAYAPRDPAADREASQRFDQLIQDDLAKSYNQALDRALEQLLPITPTGDPATPIGIVNFPIVEVSEFPAIEPLPQFANIDKLPRLEDLDPERALRPPQWLIDEYTDVIRAPMTVRKIAGQVDIDRELIDPQPRRPRRTRARERRRIWRRRYIWRPIAKRRVQLAMWIGGQAVIDHVYDGYDGDDW